MTAAVTMDGNPARTHEPPDAEALWRGVTAGVRGSLAKAFSVVESADTDRVRSLASLALGGSGGPHVIGITGPPGVGKSSLTSELIARFRERSQTVGVIAVDPSSPFSRGAVLGDRIRMQAHTEDPGVYIRSVASRGHPGGLAEAVPMGITLLAGAGYDVVIIETVGVGQSEVSVVGAADTVVVVVAPGAGDSVQAAKAGVMEIADVFVVNKADLDGVEATRRILRASIDPTSTRRTDDAWVPPVVSTVATSGEGAEPLAAAVRDHQRAMACSGELVARRRARIGRWIEGILISRVSQRLLAGVRETRREEFTQMVTRVVDGKIDAYTAADRLVYLLA